MIGGYLMALQEPDKYILSIDQGTLTTRAMIFNHKGFKVAETERPLKSFTPQPGWMEHEANEIWNAVQQVIATILINTSIQPQNIAAIVKQPWFGIKILANQFTMQLVGSHSNQAKSLMI